MLIQTIERFQLMIPLKSLSNIHSLPLGKFENLSYTCIILTKVLPLISHSTASQKLSFYSKFLSFIRVISLYLVEQHTELGLFQKPVSELRKNQSPRMIPSLIDILIHYQIAFIKGDYLFLNAKYQNCLKEHNQDFRQLIQKKKINPNVTSKLFRQLASHYVFIQDLMQRYRNTSYSMPHITKRNDVWRQLVDNHALDYEIRLCETLSHLIHLRIPEKIKSPFSEAYYTESGRNAFKNFTQYRFAACYQHCTELRNDVRTLDIGCGYGNYIRVITEHFPAHKVQGIEINPEVYQNAKQAFKDQENIQIINQNFFQWNTDESYDIALLNYAIFYFDRKQKSELLHKIHKLLKPGGSLLICQYFSQIEPLKDSLAKYQKDTSYSKRIARYYGNKILYANTLWNDSVDTFSEAARWNEICTLAEEAGLKAVSITHADPFYYSLFVRFVRSED